MQIRFLQSARGASRAVGDEATDVIARTLLDVHGLPEGRAREALAGCVRAGRVGIVAG